MAESAFLKSENGVDPTGCVGVDKPPQPTDIVETATSSNVARSEVGKRMRSLPVNGFLPTRALQPSYDLALLPKFGLHNYDVMLPLGNLIDDVRAAEREYLD